LIYFTSDTHFGHANILDHMPGRLAWGSTIDEHDEFLIDEWNKQVGSKDTVYHLGDFSFSRKKAIEVTQRLNGHICLIRGNHDVQNKVDKIDRWMEVADVKYLKTNGIKLFLSHYAHRTWRSSNHGSYHLYGHSHGQLPPLGKSCDVGVDVFTHPVDFDIIKSFIDGEFK